MASYIATKYTGVQYRDNLDGSKTFYIRYKVNGKLKREKIGLDTEGITAAYCNKFRAKRTSIERLGELAPESIKESNQKKIQTVKEVADKYLNSLKNLPDYANTVGRYDNHLNQPFGKKLLTEITTEDIERFVTKKQNEISFKTGRTYANKTINDMINLLNAIYNYAINILEYNIKSPAKSKKKKSQAKGIVRLTEDNARQKYLTEEEIHRLYNGIINRSKLLNVSVDDNLTKEILLFTKIALSTGARMTSILNMRKRDFNLSERTVNIKDFKNDSTYIGYLSDGVTELLKDKLINLNPGDCVIGGDITPKHRGGINKALQPILNKLFNEGLAIDDTQNRVVIHTFRHTYGSLLAIKSTPIYTIQKLMNHKDISMTMRYAKLAPEQGKNVVLSLGV